MITETFVSLALAVRQLFKNWRSALILATIYAALLASLYLFVTTREASIPQVALTFALAVATPLLFFALQAITANSAGEITSGAMLKKSLLDLWKVLLVSVPVILVGLVLFYLLNKAQPYLGAGTTVTVPPDSYSTLDVQAGVKQPIHWGSAILTSIRYLTFGLVLPLTLIHFWLSTVHDGVWPAIRSVKDHLLRVFSPRSVLIYMSGFVVFGVLPYLLLFRTTNAERAWLELSLFVGRLALVFALTLFGWVITVLALSVSHQRRERVRVHE
jgi:hypothetical protein